MLNRGIYSSTCYLTFVTYKIKHNRTKPWIIEHFIRWTKIKNLWKKHKISLEQNDYHRHRNFSNTSKIDFSYEETMIINGLKLPINLLETGFCRKFQSPLPICNNNTFSKSLIFQMIFFETTLVLILSFVFKRRRNTAIKISDDAF